MQIPRNKHARYLLQSLLSTALCVSVHSVWAGSLEQAKRIHDRLAGVPPTEAVLLSMQSDIESGNGIGAAYRAMDNESFYNVTIKNWAAPWTNRESDAFVPLNDYIATVIGLVRDSDQIDYREVLYGDHLYTGADSLNIPAYSNTSNAHYEALEDQGISLKDQLIHRRQSSVNGLPEDATAGVVTSRAGAKAFFIDGTNRAQFRFTLINHLCIDLEQVHDVTLTPDRIRQDVSRSPGGDSRVFLNTCVGCHNGMDPMAQAYAFYDYVYDAEADPLAQNGYLEYNVANDIETGSRVQPKYFNNDETFAPGFRTPNDEWQNYWRNGQNVSLGWDENLQGHGTGARSMMQELAHSRAFSECAVRKVFEAVCLRTPHSQQDLDQLGSMRNQFEQGGQNIKSVFAESAVYCAGN